MYSNIGTPVVYLNGKPLEGVCKGYTEVHYVFDKVTLVQGKNILKAVVSYQGKEYILTETREAKNRGTVVHENKKEHAGW